MKFVEITCQAVDNEVDYEALGIEPPPSGSIDVLINKDKVVFVEQVGDGTCRIHMTTGEDVVAENDYDELKMILQRHGRD